MSYHRITPELRASLYKTIHEILERHVGKENAIDAGQIGRLLGIYADTGHVRARGLIKGAIKARKIPAAATSAGYYIVKDEAELDDYLDRLERRLSAIAERKALLYHAFHTHPMEVA